MNLEERDWGVEPTQGIKNNHQSEGCDVKKILVLFAVRRSDRQAQTMNKKGVGRVRRQKDTRTVCSSKEQSTSTNNKQKRTDAHHSSWPIDSGGKQLSCEEIDDLDETGGQT
jgi:hypothetical protein